VANRRYRDAVAVAAQDTIHDLELEKIGLLHENTNLTDELRFLVVECRHQEHDLDLSRKGMVGTLGMRRKQISVFLPKIGKGKS